MANQRINRTQSSYSDDPKLNRAHQTRRDTDVIKTPKIGLEDIDYAIYYHIKEVIRPYIIEKGNIVEVPVIFAAGETWSQVQKHGYLRDRNGKQLTPLITIRRNSMSERDDIRKLDINRYLPENNILAKSSYTKTNTYDRFSVLNNVKKSEEYYTIAIPEFMNISYDINIWAEWTTQLNNVIEMIQPAGGYAWGDTYKFITKIRDFNSDKTNTVADGRFVRANCSIDVSGMLLREYEYRESNIRKSFSVKRIVFGNEFVTDNTDVDNPPPGGFPESGKSFKNIHRKFDSLR